MNRLPLIRVVWLPDVRRNVSETRSSNVHTAPYSNCDHDKNSLNLGLIQFIALTLQNILTRDSE